MMKKYVLIAWIGITALTSCKNDDHPVVPELNKLTRISCYKNGSDSPEFVANINYSSEGRITNIQFSGDNKLLFIYSDNKFSVTDVNSGSKTAEYTLSGDVIIRKSISQENKSASNEIYVSDDYQYEYSGINLSNTIWTTRWPKENGKEYEVRINRYFESYKWENENVVLYSQSTREMKYEYGVLENPANYPWRVIGSFNPVGFDAVTPLNLQYGARNRNLPEHAYTYSISSPTQIDSEYTYNYTQVGDYITAMMIQEENHLATGGKGSVNTYKYSFEYNYVIK